MPRTRPWSELRDRVMANPESAARIADYSNATEVALAIGEIRDDRERNSERPADIETDVSRVTHADNAFVTSLRNYIEMLGGELRVTAVFPDQEIIIAPTIEPDSDEPNDASP